MEDPPRFLDAVLRVIGVTSYRGIEDAIVRLRRRAEVVGELEVEVIGFLVPQAALFACRTSRRAGSGIELEDELIRLRPRGLRHERQAGRTAEVDPELGDRACKSLAVG